jgi:hypothetical protein
MGMHAAALFCAHEKLKSKNTSLLYSLSLSLKFLKFTEFSRSSKHFYIPERIFLPLKKRVAP